MSKFEVRVQLDDRSPLDKEVLRLLNKYRSPLERKNFLESAVLYYSRAPQFLAQEEMRLQFEGFLSELRSIESRFKGRLLEKKPSVLEVSPSDSLVEAECSNSTKESFQQEDFSNRNSLSALASQFEL